MRIAVSSLTLVTVLVGAWLVAQSPLLAVHQVLVEGAAHTRRATVLASAGLDRHPPMLDIDLAAVGARVEALPWVAGAQVRREWPTTVSIAITERTPAAQVPGPAGQPAVVDAAGRVLAVGVEASRVVATEALTLPLLRGVAPAGRPGSTLASAAQGALTVLQAVDGLVAEGPRGGTAYRVAAITRDPDGTVRATLAPGAVDVVFGGPDQVTAKVVALRSILGQLPPGGEAVIDVQVPETPVLTGGKNSSSLSTTQRG
jgi:cell division protein FtsQ